MATTAEIADIYDALKGLRGDIADLSKAMAVRDEATLHCRAVCEASRLALHGDGNGKPGLVARVRSLEGVQAAVVWAGGAFASVVTLIGAVVGIVATIRQLGGG